MLARAHGRDYLEKSPLARMARAQIVSPQGDEPLLFYTDQLDEYLKAHRVETLIYMGFATEEIGPLLRTSKEPVPISGVCAVFAESEVINHLTLGTPPADIMQGAIESLTSRCIQLMRRVKAAPEHTLIGPCSTKTRTPSAHARSMTREKSRV